MTISLQESGLRTAREGAAVATPSECFVENRGPVRDTEGLSAGRDVDINNIDFNSKNRSGNLCLVPCFHKFLRSRD